MRSISCILLENKKNRFSFKKIDKSINLGDILRDEALERFRVGAALSLPSTLPDDLDLLVRSRFFFTSLVEALRLPSASINHLEPDEPDKPDE